MTNFLNIDDVEDVNAVPLASARSVWNSDVQQMLLSRRDERAGGSQPKQQECNDCTKRQASFGATHVQSP